MIKKTGICFLLAFLVTSGIFSESADLVYAEGFVDLKLADGEIVEAFIGDFVETGDTIITGEDSLAEMVRENGSTIKISPDTIFTFQEIERDGERRSVFATTLGLVKFKFDRFTGKEPLIATPGTVAGVRGTEFQVLAGADGTTLVIVESGKVVVEAAGESVELLPEEGVEVPAGGVPGEKFTVLHGQMDFSSWNADKLDSALEDPAAAIQSLEKSMASFASELDMLTPLFAESNEELKSERAILAKMKEDKKSNDELADYYSKTVFPLEVQTSYIALNQRYYALSALSFRRFVLGSLYARVKSLYIGRLTSASYMDFAKTYSKIIREYERAVVPLLVEADI
ncbi:MAG: FecR domain-containing protein [Spirochaetales bacterium]|jgi:hypothetical protein|nr:FecR domain-containing protein [Spirochaetales bacterium]